MHVRMLDSMDMTGADAVVLSASDDQAFMAFICVPVLLWLGCDDTAISYARVAYDVWETRTAGASLLCSWTFLS